jgi:prohibitin 2
MPESAGTIRRSSWLGRRFRKLTYRIDEFFYRHRISLAVGFLLFGMGLAYLAPRIIVNVPPGYVGVLWKRFGGGTAVEPNAYLGEGFRLKLPWDHVFLYNLRVQATRAHLDAISNDGVTVGIEAVLRFSVNAGWVGVVQKSIGPDYVGTVLLPELGSKTREVVSLYGSEDLYGARRAEIQEKIMQRVDEIVNVKPPGFNGGGKIFNIEDFLIADVTLPEMIREAINKKIAQNQLAQEYKFRLQREENEKKRKILEAEGIRAFQDIIQPSISESFLRWKGIEATLELAKSNNSKVVVIGAGDHGLPLILGNENAAVPNNVSIPPSLPNYLETDGLPPSSSSDTVAPSAAIPVAAGPPPTSGTTGSVAVLPRAPELPSPKP